MASLVTDNPFDTQQPAATNTGIVGGAMQQAAPTSGQLPATASAPAPATPAATGLATYVPKTSQINQQTETVQGQVNSILSKDSPLMQRARTLATQQMAQRGLVNSSMSQGAGVAAMIDRATPIAAQDAQTYSNRALANQQVENDAGMFNTGETNKFGLQAAEQKFTTAQNELQRAFQSAENDKSITAQVNLQNAQQEFQKAQSELDRQQQAKLANDQIVAQTAAQNAQIAAQQAAQDAQLAAQQASQNAQLQFSATQANLDRENQASMLALQDKINDANVSSNFAATVAINTSNSINQILTDPNLDPDKKPAAVQNVVDAANSTVQWGSTFYNTPLPTIAAPGGTAGTTTPGANAGSGSSAAGQASASAIAQAYQQSLGRAPDPGGLAFWIGTGLSSSEIATAISRSTEAQQRATS